jgi:cell division protein FtsL
MKALAWLNYRVRGFRLLDIGALVVFLTLALAVYAIKTSAGSQRADIADIEDQIHDQSRQVRLLRAEVAHLENPQRLERLAGQYAGMAPVNAKHEVASEALPQVAGPRAEAAGSAP